MTEIFAPYKWEALFARWPDILAAFGMTAAISALALVIALVLGFVFGVFAVSRFRILRALTRVYVETVQNMELIPLEYGQDSLQSPTVQDTPAQDL